MKRRPKIEVVQARNRIFHRDHPRTALRESAPYFIVLTRPRKSCGHKHRSRRTAEECKRRLENLGVLGWGENA